MIEPRVGARYEPPRKANEGGVNRTSSIAPVSKPRLAGRGSPSMPAAVAPYSSVNEEQSSAEAESWRRLQEITHYYTELYEYAPVVASS